ncbi:hypothetical protein [Paraliobacillus sediminis]|uniref:hypothetical protein n=1 Tax=Paraliobacillus sediminis TaxID=1885916 RepID=UPI000E3C342D|nr:hypothetical protein [Paraliobacillus sediminis]
MYELVYYFVLIFSVLFYLFFIKLFNFNLFRYSNILYFFSVTFISIPGYEIASGNLIAPRYNNGFDIEVYSLYLFYTVLIPVGLIIGNLIGKNIYIQTREFKSSKIRLKIVLLFIVIYAVGYFLWLPTIPLNYLIANPQDIFNANMLRLQSTHLLGENVNLPFIFRYWRNIIQILLLILFVFFILEFNDRKRMSTNRKIFTIMLSFFVLYSFTFTLEKAPLMYVIIAIALTSLINKKFSIKIIIRNFIIGIIAITIMYAIFMGASINSLKDVISVPLNRIFGQSSATYYQIEYVRQNGFLHWNGIPMPFVGDFFNYKYVDVSEWAYQSLYSQYSTQGGTGTTGGMSLAKLYYAFSWYSIPIFFVFVIAYGLLDAVLFNSTKFEKSTLMARRINLSIYIFICSFYSLALVSSVFSIFSIPIIFNPSFYFVILLYLFLIDVGNMKIHYKK